MTVARSNPNSASSKTRTGALLLKSDLERADAWLSAFETLMPELEVRVWPDLGIPTEVEFALLWDPPDALFEPLSELKILFSIGAGLDHLLQCSSLPRDVPLIRMVEDALTEGMTEYVVFNVLRFHRGMHIYDLQQRRRQWLEHTQIRPGSRTVGIMGLGELGAASATALRRLGFNVAGWSRSRKSIDGVTSYAGAAEFDAFLSQSEILVCLLPLTSQTEGILNAQTFSKLPSGAFLINAGRGGHLIERDLVAALESRRLSGAALDVFATEPLSPNDRLWRTDFVYITPHVASMTAPETAAKHVVSNIKRFKSGQPLTHVVDLDNGY